MCIIMLECRVGCNVGCNVKSMKLSCDTLVLSKWSIASTYDTILYIVTQLCKCNIFIYVYSQVCIMYYCIYFLVQYRSINNVH